MDFLLKEKSIVVGQKLAVEADPELKALLFRSRLSNQGKTEASRELHRKAKVLIQDERTLDCFFKEYLDMTLQSIRREIAKMISGKQVVPFRELPGLLSLKNQMRPLEYLLQMMRSLIGMSDPMVIAGGSLQIVAEIPLQVHVPLPRVELDSLQLSRLFVDPLLQKGAEYLGQATREITEHGVAASPPVRRRCERKAESAPKPSSFDAGLKDLLSVINHGRRGRNSLRKRNLN